MIWITGHLTGRLSQFQSEGYKIIPGLVSGLTGCDGSAGRCVSFTTLDQSLWSVTEVLKGVSAQTAVGDAALWVKILVWRSLDHVAGWEMGNELFWAKSQEQSGF